MGDEPKTSVELNISCWNRGKGCIGKAVPGNVFCVECKARVDATGESWPKSMTFAQIETALKEYPEQRFRKPSDSQELPQASEPAPGNAGNAVDEALAALELPANFEAPSRVDALGVARVLSSEVRRLRVLYAKAGSDYAHEAMLRDDFQTKAARLREERDEARAKLARVEALPDKWRTEGFDRESQAADMCIDLARALRD